MDSPQYETFAVLLTRQELLDYGQKLSNEISKIAALRAQLSTTQSVVKGSILEHETEVTRLSKLIREGKEEREVELIEQPDYSSREIILERKDNFEEVRRRPMDDEEVQKYFQKNLFTEPVISDESVTVEALGEPLNASDIERGKQLAQDDRTVAEAAGINHTHRMTRTQRGKA